MKIPEPGSTVNQGVARARGGNYYAELESVAPDYCEIHRSSHRVTLAKVGTVITVL